MFQVHMMTGARSEDRPLNIQALLGIGTDGDPGETRITRGQNFFLYGGSRDTHEQMVETALRINEKVGKRGKRLPQISANELAEIAQELMEEA